MSRKFRVVFFSSSRLQGLNSETRRMSQPPAGHFNLGTRVQEDRLTPSPFCSRRGACQMSRFFFFQGYFDLARESVSFCRFAPFLNPAGFHMYSSPGCVVVFFSGRPQSLFFFQVILLFLSQVITGCLPLSSQSTPPLFPILFPPSCVVLDDVPFPVNTIASADIYTRYTPMLLE